MKMAQPAISTVVLALVLALSGCTVGESDDFDSATDEELVAELLGHDNVSTFRSGTRAIVRLEPTDGNSGRAFALFVDSGESVALYMRSTRLSPEFAHPLQIKEGAECGSDGRAAGGPFTIDGVAPELGTLDTDSRGRALIRSRAVERATLDDSASSLIGRTLVVHGSRGNGNGNGGNGNGGGGNGGNGNGGGGNGGNGNGGGNGGQLGPRVLCGSIVAR